MNSKKKILVGLSGGVDSAVTCYLLKEQGFDVSAIFMHNWKEDEGYCKALEDEADARKVAEHLDIDFSVVDFSEDYQNNVFKMMLQDLLSGLTPNPDILCNRYIKFGVLLEYAKAQGYERIATGHYANIKTTADGYGLYMGIDQSKDQSYFLARMPKEALAHVVFPLGGLHKKQIREIALDAKLPVAKKQESMGICFIGQKNFNDFIGQYLLSKPGDIINDQGEVVGEHQGLFYHTIGQRRGLKIGGMKNAKDLPWYVYQKDLENNLLKVTQNSEHSALKSDMLFADKLTLLSTKPMVNQSVSVRFRHLQKPIKANIARIDQDKIALRFEHKQWAIAPGQEVVLYDHDGRLIAGAQIK